jgi:hypothetical protein
MLICLCGMTRNCLAAGQTTIRGQKFPWPKLWSVMPNPHTPLKEAAGGCCLRVSPDVPHHSDYVTMK